MSTAEIIYIVIAIVNFLLLLIGGGVAYGKLIQKTNTTDGDVVSLKRDVKELRTWGESEINKAVADRNDNFLRKDVFLAQHKELCGQVREILDLKLPAFMSRLEANQTQLALDMARLQVSIEKMSERLMEMN